jgi:BCD family chlorophyll transporter-like MFS transporter
LIVGRKTMLRIPPNLLPFAGAVSQDLPLAALARLSLFQVSVGIAQVLLLGTLNRVMIVELSVPALIVATMIAIPVLVAPFRAFLGHRSDTHRSAIGWKRVPYLWFGSLWQMGGLAIMPFALIVLSGDQVHGPAWAGEVLAALAFLMTGLGMHMAQTAGLALACDRATDETRPRVVASLYIMNLLGMAVSAVVIGWLLADFDQIMLIQVVQGAALLTLILNLVALWRQERVRPMTREERAAPRVSFREAWADLMAGGTAGRLLVVVFLGTLGFTMQDVLLEPYGGEILGLSVGQTTWLTACTALGALSGFLLAGRWLAMGLDPARMTSRGILFGITAFSAVIFAGPMQSVALFFAGAGLIGLGAGIFGVSTLTAAMTLPQAGSRGAGLALGAWGGAQATALGFGVFLGGGLRDGLAHLIASRAFGDVLTEPSLAYSVVYHTEIAILFGTLIALGPLVKVSIMTHNPTTAQGMSLPEFPT